MRSRPRAAALSVGRSIPGRPAVRDRFSIADAGGAERATKSEAGSSERATAKISFHVFYASVNRTVPQFYADMVYCDLTQESL